MTNVQGSSGGPLVTLDGTVAGVNTLGVDGTVPGYCRAVRSTAGAGASGTLRS